MSRRLVGALGIALLFGCTGAGPSTELDPSTRQAIADTVRSESDRMLVVMRARNADSVLAFYGRNAAYASDGTIGDWAAIVARTGGRYDGYTKVDCSWPAPIRVDVLSRTAAAVTGVLVCEKADTSGSSWVERVARTEVVAIEDGRWRIVALHESITPGEGGLR